VTDHWARWVLTGRDGGDQEVLRRRSVENDPCRDRILHNAGIGEGDVVLDVGTGSGFLAFAALDKVGAAGRVVFADISADLLDVCARRAEETGVRDRCQFVRASADDLAALPSRSVDVVVSRSVIMYLARKDRVFEEYHRVLRPGGRMSCFEPINSFGYPEPPHLLLGLDVGPVARLAVKVKRAFSPPGDSDHFSTVDFDQKDLLGYAERAGFGELRLDFHARRNVREPLLTDDWEVLSKVSPNPLAPTLGDAVDQALTADEQREFIAYLRAYLAEATSTIRTDAHAYLWAVGQQ
jgi:arsenite methyltransferase